MQDQYDVIVVGGGPSGITAALSAGRSGVSVLLIERYGFLGGMSSSALVYPWFSFHDLSGNQIVGGLAQEIVDNLVINNGSPGHQRDTVGFVWSVTPFDKEVLKTITLEMLLDANVDIVLHSFVENVEVKDDEITSITTTGKYGSNKFKGNIIIDSTGDADIAYLAGAPCSFGRPIDNKVQAMTLIFRMGNVDIEIIKSYIIDHPNEFHTPSVSVNLKEEPLTGVSGFFKHWKMVPNWIPRDRFLFFIGPRSGEITVNTTRIINIDPRNTFDITMAEIQGRKQLKTLVQCMTELLPGFQNSFLLESAAQVGVRESRRIEGKFILKESDVTNNKEYFDVIGRCGYPIDIHEPASNKTSYKNFSHSYGIPFRVMLPQKIKNLLVTGRAVSTTHKVFSSLRVTAPVMALGQAAGTAAALVIKEQYELSKINIQELQKFLKNSGAIL